MTLKLGIRIELEKGNVAAGAREAAREIEGIGTSAHAATSGARVLVTSLEEMAAKVDPLAAATLRYKRELAELRAAHEATAISSETLIRREVELKASFERTMSAGVARASAMKRAAESIVARQTITPDRAGDIAAYGAGLDQLQARFDPLFAAQQRYAIGLAEVRRAHAVGAVDARALADREAEFRAELERTTASLVANSSGMSRYLAARNGGRDMRADVIVARQTITPDRAGDIAAYGAGLDALQVQFDPLFAAQQRYLSSLAEVRRAHAVGAIDAKTLATREVEYRSELDRTTASLVANSSVMSRYLAARNGGRDMSADVIVARQTITPDRAGDIAAYGAEMDALRAKYNPLWAAGQTYKTTIEDIARAERVGALTAVEATAARQRAKAATAAHVEALRGHTGAMKLNAMQATQLSYQLNDVFVSLASGQNPMMVAIQQGSQIGQIFGGIGNAAKAALAWITPARAAIGLTIGGAIVAMKALDDRSRSLLNLKTSVDGVGHGVGATAAQVADLAARAADAGGVSVAAAREMATEYARTGAVGEEHFGTLIRIQKSFAATIGQEVEPATKQLAEMIADPAKGAETLSRSYHLVDDASARVITRLAEQNKVTEAQALLLAVLEPRLVKASDAMLGYERLGQRARVTLSNMWEGIGKAETGAGDWITRKVVKATTGATDEQLDAALSAKREVEAAAAKMRRAFEQADSAGKTGIAIAGRSPAVDEQLRQIALQKEIDALDKSRSSPGMSPEEQERIATAIDAKTRAQATWTSEIQRSRQVQEIDLAVMQTRDPVERAQLERKRALIQIAGQEVTAIQATVIGDEAYARVLGEVSAQARATIADISADAAARTRVNGLVASGAIALADANRELQIDAATRQLVIQLASAEGTERTRLLDLIRQTRTAIVAQDQAQRIASAQQSLASGDDRLEAMRAEIALIGQSEAARARSLALLEAEQRIRREGLGGTAIADQIRAQAAATAELTTALERQKAAWEEVKTSGGTFIDTLTEGLRTGKDISQQLVDDITKELMKLTVANPLKNWMFGQNLPEIGDVAKTLFGGRGSATPAAILPQSVGTATITAGTVVVNGGIAGAGVAGGLGAPANSNDISGRVPAPGAVTRSDLPPPAANDNGGNARIAGAWDQFPTPQQRIAGAWDQFPAGRTSIDGREVLPMPRPVPSFASPAAAPGAGLPLQLGGNYVGSGVDPRLTDILTKASTSSPYDVRLVSGYRAGDPRMHGQGLATDIQLVDRATGRALPNYQDAASFRQYEQFAQSARGVQMRDYPELADQFRWGGYFGGPKGRYGALDTMHFDLGGNGRVGMAGGSWARGLTPEQLGYFPGAQSVGLSQASAATTALDQFAVRTQSATANLGGFGDGLLRFTDGLGSGGGGLFGSLLKLFGFADGGVFAGGDVIPFAAGGVVGSPTIFSMSGGRTGLMGEAGPEAIMPLTRGADGKLGVVAQMRTTAAAQPMVISASELKRVAGMGGGATQPAPAPSVVVPITVNNRSGSEVSVQSRSRAGGGREYEILVRDVGDHVAATYGLRTPNMRR